MKKIIVLAFVMISYFGYSQTPDEIAQGFFTDFQLAGIEVALNNIPKDSVLSEPGRIKTVTNQFLMQKSKLGEYYGYEKNETDEIAGCLIVYSYVLRYENSPALMDIIFYKPDDKWLVHNIIMRKLINETGNKCREKESYY